MFIDGEEYCDYCPPGVQPPHCREASMAQRESVILSCHRLPFLRDSHANLSVIDVIFSHNDNAAPG